MGSGLDKDPVIVRFLSPAEPLVEKNMFRRRNSDPVLIPDYEAVRSCLPIPVLPEDAGWEDLYWKSWEAYWKSLQMPAPGSPLIAGFHRPKDDNGIEMGHSALQANLSGYVPGIFSLVGFLDNFYASQQDDGFICRELDPKTGVGVHPAFEPNSTGPNLLAWTEWRNFRLTGDKDRIAAVFHPLMAYHRWCRENRTWRDGLYWTTGYASGLLNQPRVPDGRYHHRHWAWIDASAQAAINCTMLERMSILLDEPEYCGELVTERDELVRRINESMWNEALNFYQDVGPDNRFSPVKSIAGFWTLLDVQIVPKERLTPFIQHLRDTWSFRTELVVPTLSADSDAYNPRTGNGWRGAVWPLLTYIVQRGLNVAEQHGLAHKLAINQVDAVSRIFEETGIFWENYAPEVPEPAEPPSEDISGSTPAAIIPMILENILGFSVDSILRQVIWRRFLDRKQPYGVRNLRLGNDGTVDLVGGVDSIHIRTDAPFTLVVHNDSEIVQTAVPAGEFNLSFK